MKITKIFSALSLLVLCLALFLPIVAADTVTVNDTHTSVSAEVSPPVTSTVGTDANYTDAALPPSLARITTEPSYQPQAAERCRVGDWPEKLLNQPEDGTNLQRKPPSNR